MMQARTKIITEEISDRMFQHFQEISHLIIRLNKAIGVKRFLFLHKILSIKYQ